MERRQDGVYVRGEIDLAVAHAFGGRLQAEMGDADGSFFIDLADVTFMDSTGIAALMIVFEGFREKDIVVLPSPEVYRALQVMGLAEGAWNVELRMPKVPHPGGAG